MAVHKKGTRKDDETMTHAQTVGRTMSALSLLLPQLECFLCVCVADEAKMVLTMYSPWLRWAGWRFLFGFIRE